MNAITHKAWRNGALWIGAAMIGLVVLIAGINSTRAPLQLARTFVRIVEERTGWDVELRGARFAGVTKLRLTDVAVRSDNDGLEGNLPVVDISFNPVHLLIRRGADPSVGSVHLIRPRFAINAEAAEPHEGSARSRPQALAAGESKSPRETARFALEVRVSDGLVEEVTPQGETARLWRVDGRLDVAGDGATPLIHQAHFKQVGGGIEFTLGREAGSGDAAYQWEAKGPAEFFLTLLGFDHWRITGAMQAQGVFSFNGGAPVLDSVRAGRVSARVLEGDLAWGGFGPDERAAFDVLTLEVEGEDDVWRVESLTLEKGDALVRAAGEVKRDGGSPSSTEMELTVAARGLTFPDDLPVLQKYGLGGEGEFSGVLSGDLFDPALSGKLTIRNGTVWHRPVTRGEGAILLTGNLFRFRETVLERGFSTYTLIGEIEWATSPSRLEIALDADRGDVSELLKAFSIDADVTGRIDGRISIAGLLGDVRLAGDASVSDILVGDVRYFDRARGRFSWNDDVLTLDSVEAESGSGVASLNGRLSGEALALEVTLDRWPIEAGSGPLASLPAGVAGWASYKGRLSGSAESPQLSGEILGGHLELGRIALSDPRGSMSLTLDTLELSDLSLMSAGEGSYRLSGAIHGWREASPTVDLDVKVEGASLSGLLQESGLPLPALLLDGRVDGSLHVSGEAYRPDATFDLALTDDLGVAAPIRLQFGLQDGRIKLSRNTLFAAIMNASSP